MSQPPPSRQRKAWLPPSLSAVRYPAMPRPTKARTTTTQSGRPAGATTTGSAAARFTFAMGLLFARGRAFCARIIAQSPRRDGSHEPRRPASPRGGVSNERSAPARSLGWPRPRLRGCADARVARGSGARAGFPRRGSAILPTPRRWRMTHFNRREFLAGAAGLVAGGLLARPGIADAQGMAKRGDGDLLVVVDVQNDFMPGGALPVKEGDQIVPLVNTIAAKFTNVILTQDWHTPG